jgi:hypothetical protein
MLTDPDLGDTTVVTMQGWTLTHEPGLRVHFVVSGWLLEQRGRKKTSLAEVALEPGSGSGTQPLPKRSVAHTRKRRQSLDPCRLGRRYIRWCCTVLQAKRENRPLASEVEMNMAAWLHGQQG